ncbi:MAG TPA: hypothetical protein PKC43_04180 [Phycisphaerales bacterium]|nr:hypothetical protein [Phycisphaerales bacterium]HMP36625.1 hypothetical protein [Phycisphaerales bacterium]
MFSAKIPPARVSDLATERSALAPSAHGPTTAVGAPRCIAPPARSRRVNAGRALGLARLPAAAALFIALPLGAGTYFGPGAVIPDAPELEGTPAFVASELTVTDALTVEDFTLTIVGLEHTWVGDLSVELLHVPSGRSAMLVFRVGLPPNPPPNTFGDSSNLDGTYAWNDGAAADLWATAAQGGTNFVIPGDTYFPSAAGTGAQILAVPEFAGINALGTWRLIIGDWAAGDAGSFASWSLAIVGSEPPPCAESGSCFEPHGLPGCDELSCCEAVCAIDASCCEIAWDEACVTQARATCLPCGTEGTGPCCQASGTPGCSDAACCQAVCAIDLFCCTMSWDGSCVQFAQALPEPCGCEPDPEPCPGDGCCTAAHAGPGCDDESCCGAVCAIDPFCCASAWDAACAALARTICCPGDLNGDGVVDGADFGILLGFIGFPAPAADFDCNGIVNGSDLGFLLGSWGPCLR